MGKTISRKSNKFAAYDFDEEEQQTEQKSQELLKKFNPKNPKNSNGDQSPIDKYLFLQVCKFINPNFTYFQPYYHAFVHHFII